MTPEEWRRLRQSFEQLCERPAAEWESALAELDESTEWRQRLLAMLRADADDPMPQMAVQQAPALHRLAASAADAEQHGTNDRRDEQIGAWQIVESIGAGGMGRVYRARRNDGRYEAEAAIKIGARGIDAGQFVHERTVLARLQHPHIARLLDGGECDDGRPYLVMELVDGLPIDRYVESRPMSRHAVLRLILDAARAVAYAHARAVLHRDLKPENIMVDGAGQVKLLDFGVAKILDAERQSDGGSRHTTAAYFTPRYAAAEQLSGDTSTTATDVFSLAVVLFELLAGVHPFASAHADEELTRRMLTADATPLRRALRRTIRHAAPHPGGGSILTGTQLRDLEFILEKALQAEPTQRFQGMDSFADELQRVIDDQPVRTRRVAASERMWRWSRRNRAASAGVVLAVLSLLTGSSIAIWQAHEAGLQRDAAVLEAQRAERVAEFLSDVFRAPDPSRSRGEEVSARELLDHSRARIGSELADDPPLRQRLQAVMADTYRSLGLYDEAEVMLNEALQQAGNQPAPGLLSTLGWVHAFQGRFDESAMRLREAAARASQIGDVQAQAAALGRLATPLLNLSQPDAAEAAILESLRLSDTLPTPDRQQAIAMRGMLANIAFMRGDLDAAEAQYRQVLALNQVIHGDSHTEVAMTYSNLATVAFRRGDWQQAETLYRQAVDINRAYFGVDNVQVAMQTRSLALTLRRQGRADAALGTFRSAGDMLAKWSGDGHPNTISVRLEALELALLMQQRDPPEMHSLREPIAALDSDELNACRFATLRDWWSSSPEPQSIAAARDCLKQLHASEANRAMAEVALARANEGSGQPVDKAWAAARLAVQEMELADPLLRAAVAR